MSRSNSSISNSETTDFLKLVNRLMLFSIPFLVLAAIILAIDPFNFFNVATIIPDEIKRPVAMQFNPPFWKLSKFEKDPKEFILIGDSRMAPLETDVIKDISGDDYANLGYGGASIQEGIGTFWFVTKLVKPKKVFIGVNPEKYNGYEITDRLSSYNSVRENPALYFVNQAVWESAYYDVNGYLTGAKFTVGTPQMTKEEFWQDDLAVTAKYYQKYADPKNYRRQLLEIADYCRKNNIDLSFIIFPTHADSQQLIVNANFQPQNAAMRRDLQACGKVYDFDWLNELTENKDNFEDPVHTTKPVRQIIIQEIWGNQLKYGKLLPAAQ